MRKIFFFLGGEKGEKISMPTATCGRAKFEKPCQ